MKIKNRNNANFYESLQNADVKSAVLHMVPDQ
jgi:hypothetical protein